MGPLAGVKIVEFAGIGPAPLAATMLADMGATVVRIDRLTAGDPAVTMAEKFEFTKRSRSAIAVDLKNSDNVALVLKMIGESDGLIEGFRPGVMERLGLGPDVCLARNPRLAYGRVTGWGQTGPLAMAAGHDLNYIALSGALWFAGEPGRPPVAPPTLVGDLGGGALYLAMGLLAGILNVRGGGSGQVVDAAIVDGSANLMNLLLSVHAVGQMPYERGQGMLDGPHWCGSYACADGLFVAVQALEPQFNALLFAKLGLGDDPEFKKPYDSRLWPRLRERLAALFATKPRQHWVDLLEGSDACFAPVLTPLQAMDHPHMAARGVYAKQDGVLQAAPAPRFSATVSDGSGAVPQRGVHTQAVLREAGLDEAAIAALLPR